MAGGKGIGSTAMTDRTPSRPRMLWIGVEKGPR